MYTGVIISANKGFHGCKRGLTFNSLIANPVNQASNKGQFLLHCGWQNLFQRAVLYVGQPLPPQMKTKLSLPEN